MRLVIAQGAGVDVADLPFAGELMDVRQEYRAQWRGALERLLRGFGLSLLVPEHLYSRVNRFINDNDLRGRVVYHRVPRDVPGFQPSHDKGRVIERMQLKDGHPLSRWVESELRTHFNYRCCESIEEFENASGFALTMQGLIRSAGTRHIKDDSTAINDPRNHILGWSNREKIRRLEDEQGQLAIAAQNQATIINDAGRRQKSATARAAQAGRLQGFRSFTEIDWRSAAARREELEQQKRELEQSSDKIKKLHQQLGDVEKQIASLDATKTETAGKRGGLEARQQESNRRRAECEVTLADRKEIDLAAFDAAATQLLAGTELTIANASVTLHKAETTLGNQLIELGNSRGKVVDSATRLMGTFLGEFPDLKADLNAGAEFIPDFLRFEENVRRDDLPRHDQKFQELMSRDVLVHIVKFQDTLEDHCEGIQSKIDHLNGTLKGIEYSPRTYIAIRANQATDPDIRNFRGRLKGCLEYGLAPDGAARENAFQRISDLIDLFSGRNPIGQPRSRTHATGLHLQWKNATAKAGSRKTFTKTPAANQAARKRNWHSPFSPRRLPTNTALPKTGKIRSRSVSLSWTKCSRAPMKQIRVTRFICSLNSICNCSLSVRSMPAPAWSNHSCRATT